MFGNLVPRVLSYPPYGAGRREPWERGWMFGTGESVLLILFCPRSCRGAMVIPPG